VIPWRIFISIDVVDDATRLPLLKLGAKAHVVAGDRATAIAMNAFNMVLLCK
jgi:hypothetical protein